MPLTVKKLSDRLVPMEMDVDGTDEKLHLVYRPSVMTPALESELSGYTQARQWAPLISRLVAEWDLYEEGAEEKVPLTEERLAELDVPFLMAVALAISGDQNPNRRTAARSGGGSLAAAE